MRAQYHGADLRQPAQIAELIEITQQGHGGLDVLVNNAVVRYFGPIENFAPEHWDEALAVNLSAPFHTIRFALPGMKAKGLGADRQHRLDLRDVRDGESDRLHHHEDSVSRPDPSGGAGGGSDGRYVQRHLSRNRPDAGDRWRLRQEMQRDGTSFAEAEESFLAVRQPSRKFVKDENVAGLIAFLCGPYAEDINGSALPIDGAWTAGRG